MNCVALFFHFLKNLSYPFGFQLKQVQAYNIGVSISYPPDTDTPGFEVENLTKPEETKLISDAGDVFKPEQVQSKNNVIINTLR